MKKIVFDMDGVLVDTYHERNWLERFVNEKDFFEKCNPYGNNCDIVQDLIDMGKDIYILSASPNEEADKAKIKWLNTHFGGTLQPSNIVIMRTGENKAERFKKLLSIENLQDYILIDDYNPNLIQWRESGGFALKYINDINYNTRENQQYDITAIDNLNLLKYFF